MKHPGGPVAVFAQRAEEWRPVSGRDPSSSDRCRSRVPSPRGTPAGNGGRAARRRPPPRVR
ncbi:hypothetical protein I552_7391 [Mycobacterium xenopi 3993]|nr:hypothetical protein I552_7391 [Mycobacterium xenopi 3993]